MVDDDVVNQQVAKLTLQRAGYRVETVGDGKKAVQACATHCYDLVLMDCSMPEMNGYEAAQHIRRGAQLQPLIIAVTALSLPEARVQCMDDVMDGYIGKPYRISQLLQTVQEKLAGRSETCQAVQ